MKPLVIYHADCLDGFCAAWVCRKALGEIDAVPLQYGQLPPDVAGREVYIVDFSFPRAALDAICEFASNVVLIDHHKTAIDALSGYTHDRLWLCLDPNYSGGRLTWAYFFHTGVPRPWLVDYTEDRDLWRHALPSTEAVNAGLRSYNLDFDLWDNIADDGAWFSRLRDEGRAILRVQQQTIDQHVAHAVEINMDGHLILAVNATVLFSEIAGKLAEGRPFGACYFIAENGRRVWSLRSREGGIDVSEIARKHGGGGHVHAAGFQE